MTEETLFQHAVHLPAADRAAFLERECAGQPELRARVEALLAADALLHAPLDRPVAVPEQTGEYTPESDGEPARSSTAEHRPDDQAGTVIAGKYTLVEAIGEGGMGSVWRAKQTEPVKRFVAVKLIKAGMDSKQVLARFDAERQALALMDHPNIAKVLDGGIHDRRPFFVMELVKGVPITDYCDANRLTPQQRLELFVQACQAIQHAHQKGIIHRDIKPSNVLVALYDDKPVVKVIDFGVAKATGGTLTEATIDTGFGGVVGTPQYMSPEQATFNNLDIDTRSDVYALGVLLYELLAGGPPFSGEELKKKGLLEILRVVREEEPPRPSTKLSTADALPSISANRGTEPKKLTGLLRNELDWIVMRALEKERTRRYETANAFAADVQRYLAGEPVQAHPPSMGYRFKKFVRRHKGQVIAASVVLLALLAGIIGTSWGLVKAKHQEGIAKYQQGLAREEAVEKERARSDEALQRQRADINLTDMLAARGLLAHDRNDPAEATLWFAAAADQARVAGDRQREENNRLRARNWLRQATAPVAALEVPEFYYGTSQAIDFQPKGDLLLVRLPKSRIALWSWRQGKLLEWTEALTGVSVSCFSPDGTTIALGFENGSIDIRSVADGRPLAQFRLPGNIQALAYSPDGKFLGIGGRSLSIWDVTGQALLDDDWFHQKEVTGLLFNRTGDRIITVSGRQARVFDVSASRKDSEPLYPPLVHDSDAPPGLVGGGRTLVTYGSKTELKLWDLETGKPIAGSWPVRSSPGNNSIAVSPDGNWFTTTGIFGSRYGTNLHSIDVRRSPVYLPNSHYVDEAAFNHDNTLLLTACWDGTARLWSVPDGNPVGPPLGHTGGWIIGCVWSDDDHHLATAESSGLIRVWRRPADALVVRQAKAWGSRPRLSFDGRLVAPGVWHEAFIPARAGTNTLQIVTALDGKPAGPAIHLPSELIDCCICRDNRTVAAIYTDPGNRLRLWDIETGRALLDPIELPASAASLDASPTKDWLIVYCGNQALLIDSRTGARLQTLKCPGFRDFAQVRFTPDGQTLILNTGSTLEVRDSETGELRFAPINPLMEGSSPCRGFAVSPDSRFLGTIVNGQNAAQVWDLATGRAVSKPLPHPGGQYGLWSIRFSPDGRRLLVSHTDGQARYWDWEAGVLACPPMGHSNEVYDAAITPDGRFALTAVRGQPTRIEAWELTTGKRVAPAIWLTAGLRLSGVYTINVTPDGRRALVASSTKDLCVIDLEPLLTAPIMANADFQRMAELATAKRIEANDLNGLPQTRWREQWDAMHQPPFAYTKVAARFGGDKVTNDLASLDRQLAANPNDTVALQSRLEIHRRLGRKWLAAADNERLVELNVADDLVSLDRQLTANPNDFVALQSRLEILVRLGRDKEAASDRERLVGLYEQLLAGNAKNSAAGELARLLPERASSDGWTTLVPTETTSKIGVKFTAQPDGSLLTSGRPRSNDTYRLAGPSKLRRISALRLEVLPHSSVLAAGPGWNGGNFQLTEIRGFVKRVEGTAIPLKFRSAVASYTRSIADGAGPRDGPTAVFDKDQTTHWNISPLSGRRNWLALPLNEPVELAPADRIVVELDFLDKQEPESRLGCFRLSVADDERMFEKLRVSAMTGQGELMGCNALAAAYLANGEPGKALRLLEPTRPLKSPRSETYRLLLLTRACRQLDQLALARKYYDQLKLRLREHTLPELLRDWAVDAMVTFEKVDENTAKAAFQNWELESEQRLAVKAKDVEALSRIGMRFLNLGKFDDALKTFQMTLNLPARQSYEEYVVLSLLAWFDRDGDHLAACTRLLVHAQDTNDPNIADDISRSCTLRPTNAETHETALDLARRALKLGKSNANLKYFHLAVGMAEYRNDHFAEADAALVAAAEAGKNDVQVRGISAFYRAMSQFRLGNKDEGRKIASEATAKMKPLPKDPKNPLVDGAGRNDLILWLVYKEAKALIGFDTTPAPREVTLPQPEKK